jgi:acetyl-CoA acyltransferase 1
MAFVQKGIKNILQKNPNDVVILSALRTPVTRAKKGGLRDAYDHEMLGAVRQNVHTFQIKLISS